MTEAEWLASDSPTQMLKFMKDKASERKLRLFSVALARTLWNQMNPVMRESVDAGELFADGVILCDEVSVVAKKLEQWAQDGINDSGGIRNWRKAMTPEMMSCFFLASMGHHPKTEWILMWEKNLYYRIASKTNRLIQPTLLREVFGNPFSPVTLNPSWLAPTVLTLANGIYEEKAFDRMPILADALQDAGCDNEDILNHCRQPGEHVRGCWVVDLLTGWT
jgi:hypothetical protein